jgi:hypothetical protein
MPDPVAVLQLDSRSWGPAYCEKCDDEDVEEVLLMSDATIVCPTCKTPMESLEHVSDLFTSVEPVSGQGLEGKRQKATSKDPYDVAFRELPDCVSMDPGSPETISELVWQARHELDMFNEGQDGAITQSEAQAVRRFIQKYAGPQHAD